MVASKLQFGQDSSAVQNATWQATFWWQKRCSVACHHTNEKERGHVARIIHRSYPWGNVALVRKKESAATKINSQLFALSIIILSRSFY